MTEVFLYGLDAVAVLERENRKCVPQVVKALLRQTKLGNDGFKIFLTVQCDRCLPSPFTNTRFISFGAVELMQLDKNIKYRVGQLLYAALIIL